MDFGIFGFHTKNIGDDVQSYAVLTHLSRVSAMLDRDRLSLAEHADPTGVVLNSWFLLGRHLAPPPPSMKCLPFGFCLGREELLTTDWRPFLSSLGRIGCRDTESAGLLRAAGVDAYWSGCLTAFFGRHFTPVPLSERREILFVDIDPETEETMIPMQLREQACRISNLVMPDSQYGLFDRYAQVARLCDRLRAARLVVTRRLHVALPCVGFGTPVVALPDATISNARRRFSGCETFLPLAFKGDIDGARAIDWDNPVPAVLPPALEDGYRAFKAALVDDFGVDPAVSGCRVDRAILTPSLIFPNPGLGFEAGEASLEFGREHRPCRVLHWSDRQIEIDFPRIFALDRLAIRVSLRSRGGLFGAVLGLDGRIIQAPCDTTGGIAPEGGATGSPVPGFGSDVDQREVVRSISGSWSKAGSEALAKAVAAVAGRPDAEALLLSVSWGWARAGNAAAIAHLVSRTSRFSAQLKALMAADLAVARGNHGEALARLATSRKAGEGPSRCGESTAKARATSPPYDWRPRVVRLAPRGGYP